VLQWLEDGRVENDGLTSENVPDMLERRERHRLRPEWWRWRSTSILLLAATLSERDVGLAGNVSLVGLRRNDRSWRDEIPLKNGDAEIDRAAHRETRSAHLGEVGESIFSSGNRGGGPRCGRGDLGELPSKATLLFQLSLSLGEVALQDQKSQ
jgi:hypothetical protein